MRAAYARLAAPPDDSEGEDRPRAMSDDLPALLETSLSGSLALPHLHVIFTNVLELLDSEMTAVEGDGSLDGSMSFGSGPAIVRAAHRFVTALARLR